MFSFSIYFIQLGYQAIIQVQYTKMEETLEIKLVARAKPTRGKPSNPSVIESLAIREMKSYLPD